MQSTKSTRTGELLPPATRSIIEAAFDEAASRLNKGASAPLYGIARASAYHQRFSPRNRLLLWGQAAHARMVRGTNGWKTLGRRVLPGAPAYYVIQPARGSYALFEVFDVDYTRGRPIRLTPPTVRFASALPGEKEEAAQAAASLIEGADLEAEIARLALLYALGLFPWYSSSARGGETLEGRSLFRVAEKALRRADQALRVIESKTRRTRAA